MIPLTYEVTTIAVCVLCYFFFEFVLLESVDINVGSMQIYHDTYINASAHVYILIQEHCTVLRNIIV